MPVSVQVAGAEGVDGGVGERGGGEGAGGGTAKRFLCSIRGGHVFKTHNFQVC